MIIEYQFGRCLHCDKWEDGKLIRGKRKMCLYVEADCHGDAEWWCEDYLKELLQTLQAKEKEQSK